MFNYTQDNLIDATAETIESLKIVKENQSQTESSSYKDDIGLWLDP